MTATKQRTFRQLKALAERSNCTVTDNKDSATVEVEANDGFSWDEGTRSCQWTVYGSGGSYLPEWRRDAIEEAFTRLEQDPPEAKPFSGDE